MIPASEPSSVVVRPAIVDDLDAVLDIVVAVAEEGGLIGREPPIDRAARAHAWRDELLEADEGELFVAVAGGHIVGSVAVADRRRSGLVDLGMQIAKPWRRRRIGTLLLERALAWAQDAGAHKVTLQVWPWNEGAIALYRRFGFVQEGYLRRHYKRRSGEIWDCLIMGLVLDPEDATRA